MAKWIKNYEMAEKCTALFFHCFFIWEGSALLYLPTQKTNKKSLLLSEFVYNWYQLYIYIYIYIYIDIYMVQLWGNRPFWKVDLSECGHEYDNFH